MAAEISIHGLIEETADMTAKRVLGLQKQMKEISRYRAMERLLRSYPTLRRWAEHPEDYDFFPREKAKDISIAPPKGAGVRDKVDITEEHIEARKRAYERTMTHYYELLPIIREYEDKEEFIVIRMVYFNEDRFGHDRGDAKRYSWGEIMDELSMMGIDRSERTVRSWRTRLVQDMTVLLFGAEGAVSLEMREPARSRKEE